MKDFFYHVPVNIEYRDLLGFAFEKKFYRWKVLPFGLNLSPFYCAKVVRPVIAYLRSVANIKCQVYVDDYIIVAPPACITDHTDMVVTMLEDLGFVINLSKSALVPSTSRSYIGFDINTVGESGHPEIWVTGARMRKLRASIRRLFAGTSGSVLVCPWPYLSAR
jgi:hypothetical protein